MVSLRVGLPQPRDSVKTKKSYVSVETNGPTITRQPDNRHSRRNRATDKLCQRKNTDWPPTATTAS